MISESAFGRNCAAPTTRNVSGRGSSDAIASAIPRWPNCMVSPGRKSGDTLGPCRQADLKREGSRSRRAWPVARHEAAPQQGARPPVRSEEHTSELQSPCNLVCRLLLEKKKKKTTKMMPRSKK